jgi:glutaredoxin
MSAPNQPPPFALAIMRVVRKLGFARGLVRSVPGTDRDQPSKPLELYALEGCGHCRRVREALTELDLDYLHRSCPFGSDRNRAPLRARGGKVQLPYLIDPNTGVELYESQAIVRYLASRYGASTEPREALACRQLPS